MVVLLIRILDEMVSLERSILRFCERELVEGGKDGEREIEVCGS